LIALDPARIFGRDFLISFHRTLAGSVRHARNDPRFEIRQRKNTMAKEKQLDDLFLDTLKDVYFAEKKIYATLPKMQKAATNAKLKAAFEKHHGETKGQIERLEQVFAEIDETPKAKTCEAIMGIVKEGEEIIADYKKTVALDAGLLAVAQAVEHYEMSRYGTLRTWAQELGHNRAVKLLDETLAQEKATDKALTELAETVVNDAAMKEAA
jgi:ferritin-like metal-binding protein YciE